MVKKKGQILGTEQILTVSGRDTRGISGRRGAVIGGTVDRRTIATERLTTLGRACVEGKQNGKKKNKREKERERDSNNNINSSRSIDSLLSSSYLLTYLLPLIVLPFFFFPCSSSRFRVLVPSLSLSLSRVSS